MGKMVESRMVLEDITVEVVFKNIKNLHLSVRPPEGRVRISAPARLSLETIRAFALSKLHWIRRHRLRFREQERETPREYLDRESHYVWGRRYLLEIAESDVAAVELEHDRMVLRLPPRLHPRRHTVVEQWYRGQMRQALVPLIAKWEPVMGVKVRRFFVRRMKTKWGSCTPSQATIRFNTDLARRAPELLEYIVVHEMAHLRVRHHNRQFYALMDEYLPGWKALRRALRNAPLADTQGT